MQVRRFLHVAPYPDPYLFLTESPISFLDQPATRSQSHLHMGPGLVSACQALRPPPSQAPRSIIVLRSPSAMITTTVPWSPRPLSVCFFFLLVSSVVVSLTGSGRVVCSLCWWGGV